MAITKAAIVNARSTAAMVRAMGLQAQNQQYIARGEYPPNGYEDFERVLVEEHAHWNAVHETLYGG